MARPNRKVDLSAPTKPVTAAEAEAPIQLQGQAEQVRAPMPTPQPQHAQSAVPTMDSSNMATPQHIPTTRQAPRPPVPAVPQQVQAEIENDAPLPQDPENEVQAEDLDLLPNEQDPENEVLHKEYLLKARQYGRDAIKGEKSLINLGEVCLEGGITGGLVINDKRDDAVNMYWDYRIPYDDRYKASHNVRNETQDSASFKNNARKLQWFIRLGTYYGARGKQLFDTTTDMHKQFLKDPQLKKDLKYTAVYEATVEIIRKQVKSYELNKQAPIMSDEDVRAELLSKGPMTSKEIAEWLAEAYKMMNKANNDGRKGDPNRGFTQVNPLKSETLADIMEGLKNFVENELDINDQRRFNNEITPKPKGKKRAAPPTASNGQQVEELEEQEYVEEVEEGE